MLQKFQHFVYMHIYIYKHRTKFVTCFRTCPDELECLLTAKLDAIDTFDWYIYYTRNNDSSHEISR